MFSFDPRLLFEPKREKETHVGKTSDGLDYGVSSMQGWRREMEDAHITEGHVYAEEVVKDEYSNSFKYNKIELHGHSIYAVFDGHGGSFAANYAANNLCRVLSRQEDFIRYAKYFLTPPESDSVRFFTGKEMLNGVLEKAFVELDKEILCAMNGHRVTDADLPYSEESRIRTYGIPEVDGKKMSGKSSSDKEQVSPKDLAHQLPDDESGTTACVVLITPDWILCANAGDTRAVVCKEGTYTTFPLSSDHKPDNPLEEERIRAAGGSVINGRIENDINLSRGLGDFRFKNMEVVMFASFSGIQPTAGDVVPFDSKIDPPTMKPCEQKVSPVPDVEYWPRHGMQNKFIIVACDGIWDVQTASQASDNINYYFGRESNMGIVCERICDNCLSMDSRDNMTLIIIKLLAQKIDDGLLDDDDNNNKRKL